MNISNNFLSKQLARWGLPVLVCYWLLAIYLILTIPRVEIEWKWAHLFFSYEFGFLKRGLLGQIFNWLSIPNNFDNFFLFSAVMIFCVVSSFYQLLKKMPVTYSLCFAAIFLSSPLLLKNLVHDWGRFDQIAIFYLFTFLILNNSKGEQGNWSTLFVCISPILLFIHEATILWVFPIMLAILYLEKNKLVYVILPLIAICLASILWFGNLNVSVPDYTTQLEHWAYPRWVHPSIVNTLTNSFSDSFHMSVQVILPNLTSKQGIFGLIELFSLLIMLLFIRSYKIIGLTLIALLCSTILFCVALDHFRWMSLMGFIILTSLLYAQQKNQLSNSNYFIAYSLILSTVNIFQAPVGIWLNLPTH